MTGKNNQIQSGTTPLPVNNGGTGLSTSGNNGVFITSNSGVPSWLANSGAPGYVLTANSGAPPSWQAGGGGGGGITWNDQTTGTVTMAASNGYVVDNGASLVTLTLPSTAALGATFQVAGFSSGGWTVAQASSQLIHLGSSVTTTGTGGSLSSTNAFDQVTITCVVANTTFVVTSSVGNLTVV